jgi:hypothetical protein
MKFPYLVNFDPTLGPADHSIGIRSLAQNVHGLFSTIQRRVFLVASAVFLVAAYAGAPGPPPFSSMNSTPANSKVRRTARSLAAVMDVSLSDNSARRMVATPTADSRARSWARRRSNARGVCLLSSGFGFRREKRNEAISRARSNERRDHTWNSDAMQGVSAGMKYNLKNIRQLYDAHL